MTNNQFEIKVPGKLFLAGEYANTSSGQASLVFAVDRFIEFKITPHSQIMVTSDLLGSFETTPEALQNLTPNGDWQLIQSALQLFNQYANENQISVQPLALKITSHLNLAGKKLGLGSSGATVVGVLEALLLFHNLPFTQLELYKLATLVLQGLEKFTAGSMGDVAAASFGGLLYYQKYDVDWLTKQNASINTLVHLEWPLLEIQTFSLPADWHVMVGWTKSPSDTQTQLQHSNNGLDEFQKYTRVAVNEIREGLAEADWSKLVHGILANRQVLNQYTSLNHIPYQTTALIQLQKLATTLELPSKISGAGNGDNGIAIVRTDEQFQQLSQLWQAAQIIPLPLKIYDRKGE
ncbi:MAG: phosphomevalonate kinase [Lactobacillaceae bacterium]|jgi:phosphomevalonate kinase|nr:phosphomevalonate kinase [Lactobacillaceae bacterium]